MSPETASRTFTMDDQRAFAELSGDANPMHVDEVAARRFLFGRPVVHGVHSLLWALDGLAARAGGLRGLSELTADFKNPVFPGVPAVLRISTGEDGWVDLTVVVRDAPATVARVLPLEGEPPRGRARDEAPRATLRVHDPDAMDGAEGAVPLCLPAAGFAALFPRLAEGGFSTDQAAALLATTRVVGMECPGLHSLYSRLSMRFEPAAEGPAEGPAELRYRVSRWHPRLRRLNLDVEAPGASGSILSFVRPAPAAGPDAERIAELVRPGEFAGQVALVVGGSRGLGEVTAKLVAGGGGTVLLTYHRGREDAEAVAAEIEGAGGRAAVHRYDLLSGAGFEPDLGELVSHLYYFAAPRITTGAAEGLDEDLYRSYRRYFVDGLRETFERVRARARPDLLVFHPSTIFVETRERGFAEYIRAKEEAESLVVGLAGSHPRMRFVNARLPRLETDQAQSLMPVLAAEPTEELLARLRGFGGGEEPGA